MSAKGSSSNFDHSCSCQDCQNYLKQIGNFDYVKGDDIHWGQCKNSSFHETSVESNIKQNLCKSDSKDCKSCLMPNKWPSLPNSLFESKHEDGFKPTEDSSRSLPKSKNSLVKGNVSLSTGHLPNRLIDFETLEDNPHSSHSAVQLSSNIPLCICNDNPIVYVTFAPGSKRHEQEVADLCEICDGAGFTVKCDSDRTLMENGELNVNQWRDINFQRAACILFCISPAYNGMLKLLEEDNIAIAEENDRFKGALYIFNLARAELVDSYSIDRRFFCVLFTNSAGKLEVPRCFTPYAKFKFPEESQILVSAMQNRYIRNQRRL